MSESIASHARVQPDKVGTRDSKRALTFAGWNDRASRRANGLLALGLNKGDRVVLLAYNCIEWMEIYVALTRAGLVAVSVNFRLLPADILYIALHIEASATGRPKGAIRNHEGNALLALATALEFGFSREDTGLLVMPMCHANSLYFGLTFMYLGATVVVDDTKALTRRLCSRRSRENG